MGAACGVNKAAKVEDGSVKRARSMSLQKIEKPLKSSGSFAAKYRMLDEVLGSGSFAVVRKCEERATGKMCACKIISKYRRGKEVIEAEYLNDEVRILRRCGSHEHVLEIYDVYETLSSVYLVLELATGGSLLDRVLGDGKFSEKDAALIVRQITEAIGFLHSQGVVHRDLKPANLLLRDTTSFCVKVTDFGLSKAFAEPKAAHAPGLGHQRSGPLTSSARDHQLLMQTACGSRAYAAPEVLNGTEYDQSVDVWGIGVIMAILLTGEHPMSDVRSSQMLKRMQANRAIDWSKKYWKAVSAEARALLAKILRADSAERPAPDAIVQDKWFESGVAPSTPLPHVLDGLRRLRLGGLQKLVLQLMATKVNDASIQEETERLFSSLDVRQDGVVRKAEIDEVMTRHGNATEQYRSHLDKIFATLDLDETGVVKYVEFQAAMLTQQQALMKNLLMPVFNHLDVNNNGTISAREVVTVFGEMGTDLNIDDVQAMIDEHDDDKSGVISFQEFLTMMNSLTVDEEAKQVRRATGMGSSGSPAPRHSSAPQLQTGAFEKAAAVEAANG